jgi:membrane protease subunit HflC
MKAQKILLPIIAVIGALIFFSIFIVKEVNQAIVLQFGDPKKIIIEPGLNFKLPFIQNVVFLDSRNFKFRHSASRSYCIRSKKINC